MTMDCPGGRDLQRLMDIVSDGWMNGAARELLATALSIMAREAENGDAVNTAYAIQLSTFYNQSASNDGVNLNRRLAEDIRNGTMDAGERARSAHKFLQTHARARLAISNPEYLDES
jgi:hypothetical protein